MLGLVATLVGTYFTYISFVNPIKRFKKYLKNPENWEKFQGIENHLSFYRHKKYPNFQPDLINKNHNGIAFGDNPGQLAQGLAH